ncbi:FMN-binding negative transcriptional regulator [Alisedimentitalea sp. MJ-SS2]|uniref:FMN-binding negative transcriptional regulator n=1 Tax=Aliisedimentitalea sp. MJ-SS2 TaxID=3049795 RepID=UPI00291149CA|nr:FMN-binding negative transcriptional regulator [Alisedimentitalea sp. MJ-SS2]MDU8927663.1 FMN-binding negative transcriptional regulator [Alisedimentitalea sp. MJ-SS2]
MHPNLAFRPERHDEDLALVREWGFGMLAVSVAGEAPMLSHVPFLVDASGAFAELHLVRSNPIARVVKEGAAARIAVQGPHGYISPDWYGIEDQVPTWNYVAIHLTGVLAPRPQDELQGMLERLAAHFEAQLTPKPPWLLDKMDAEAKARLMRMIAPFRFAIERVDSTWKLAQNKPDAARHGAADHIAAQGMGQEVKLLAAMMRNPPNS